MTWIKPNYILQIICSLLIFLFVYTALSKFLEFNTFRNVLSKSPLVGNKSETLAWTLPIIEISIALLLLIPKTQRIGLWASTVLMLVFTFYISYMILFVPHLPCSCGGVIRRMNWKQHLAFNLVFTLLAFAGTKINRAMQKNEGEIAFI